MPSHGADGLRKVWRGLQPARVHRVNEVLSAPTSRRARSDEERRPETPREAQRRIARMIASARRCPIIEAVRRVAASIEDYDRRKRRLARLVKEVDTDPVALADQRRLERLAAQAAARLWS
jgi:hypothetical protein